MCDAVLITWNQNTVSVCSLLFLMDYTSLLLKDTFYFSALQLSAPAQSFVQLERFAQQIEFKKQQQT